MPVLTLIISLFFATIGFSGRSEEPTITKNPTSEETPEYIIIDMNTP